MRQDKNTICSINPSADGANAISVEQIISHSISLSDINNKLQIPNSPLYIRFRNATHVQGSSLSSFGCVLP